eukprot:113331-Pelagomonas_calceolata.AAC.4
MEVIGHINFGAAPNACMSMYMLCILVCGTYLATHGVPLRYELRVHGTGEREGDIGVTWCATVWLFSHHKSELKKEWTPEQACFIIL